MLFSGLRLGRKINKSVISFESTRYATALLNCKQKLGVKGQVRIVLQSFVKIPALYGLFRPQIILPDYAENLHKEAPMSERGWSDYTILPSAKMAVTLSR